MPELKKLRLMARKKDIPEARVQSKTRKYMLTIGDKIASLPRDDGLPSVDELWEFVAEFTENENDGGPGLVAMYETLDAKRAHGSAAGVQVVRSKQNGVKEEEEEEEEEVIAGDSASAEVEAEAAAEAAAVAAAAEYDEGYEPEVDPEEEDEDEPEDDDDEWKAD